MMTEDDVKAYVDEAEAIVRDAAIQADLLASLTALLSLGVLPGDRNLIVDEIATPMKVLTEEFKGAYIRRQRQG